MLYFQLSPPDVTQQVSSDHHKMSLAGGGVTGLMSGNGNGGLGVPGLMCRGRSNASCLMVIWRPPVNRQTHACTKHYLPAISLAHGKYY